MTRPNIIFILIDDMGWRDLTCYGSEFYETPNIDKLAKQGMLFTNAYAAAPVCSPTRASIMTGKYPARVGMTDYINGNAKGKLIDAPYIDHLSKEEKTIAQALRDGGYVTWHIGKWHLGDEQYFPENHGFDVNIGGCSMGNPGRDGYFSPYNIKNLEDGPVGEYLTDRLTTEAINLIRNNRNKPFFLNLNYYAVHTPIMGKSKYVKKYKKKAKELGLDKKKTFEQGDFFPCEHKKEKRIKRRLIQSDPDYAAMIQSLDENIGRILKTLKDVGLENDTIIIFTSDNGGLSTSEGSPTCNFPLNEGKGWMYEGGVREPLLIKWPGIVKPGSICKKLVISPDFYPTMLVIAGLPLLPGQHTDGVDLTPLFKGENSLDRETLYWHYPHYGNQGGTPFSSIRMGDYKLIEFFEDGHLELYNLEEDIGESNNLTDKKRGIKKQLQKKLKKWREKINVNFPKENPYY